MPEYKLPDVGEGLTEAEVVAWRVKVGDVIEVNEIVCDIETAKSIVELPSPYAGEVTALLVPDHPHRRRLGGRGGCAATVSRPRRRHGDRPLQPRGLRWR